MEPIKGTVSLEVNDFLELVRKSKYYNINYNKLYDSLAKGLIAMVQSVGVTLRSTGYVGKPSIAEFDPHEILKDIVEEDKYLIVYISNEKSSTDIEIIVKTGIKEELDLKKQ